MLRQRASCVTDNSLVGYGKVSVTIGTKDTPIFTRLEENGYYNNRYKNRYYYRYINWYIYDCCSKYILISILSIFLLLFLLLFFSATWYAEKCCPNCLNCHAYDTAGQSPWFTKTAVLIVLIVTGSIIIRTAPVFHCVAMLRCNVAIRSIIPKNRRIINYSIYHNVIRLPVFSRAWGGGGCLLQHCNATLQQTIHFSVIYDALYRNIRTRLP